MKSYGKLCTAFYDLDKPSPPEDAVAYYLAAIAAAQPPALEAMCGSGRFLVPLLQRGAIVDGVDASPDMLAACRARARDCGFAPALYEQFLDRLDLPTRYGYAFMPAGSLGLLHDTDVLRTGLRKLNEHMQPGASLAIEVVDRDAMLRECPQSGERVVASPEGFTIRREWTSRYHAATSVIAYASTYELRRGDAVTAMEVEAIDLRLYTVTEVMALFAEAGFVDVDVASHGERMRWLDESECALFTATKRRS